MTVVEGVRQKLLRCRDTIRRRFVVCVCETQLFYFKLL